MEQVWGAFILVLGLISWLGQTVSWFAPGLAVRLGLSEAESDVESAFWADARGEAAWDFLTGWTLPLAGLLLIVDSSAWTYLGLVGGGMYLYYGGRGIFTRLAMQQRALRVGSPESLRIAYIFLSLWGVAGFVTIIAAVMELESQ